MPLKKFNEFVEDVDGEEAESFKSDSLSEGDSTNKYQIPQKLTNYSFLKEPEEATSMAT